MILNENLGIVYLSKKKIDAKAMLGKKTFEPSAQSRFIEDDRLIVDQESGKPVIVFGSIPENSFVLEDLEKLKIAKSVRLADLRRATIERTNCNPKDWEKFTDQPDRRLAEIQNLNFGYIPARPIFGHIAGPCVFNGSEPEFYFQKIVPSAFVLQKVYEKYFPTVFSEHNKNSSEILDNYRIGRKSVFTSGVINKNVNFKYHFDKGNFKNCKSAMVVVGENYSGGYLHIPEYDVYIRTHPNTYLIFDGQSILHGVTEIKGNGKRYSIVYYTVEKLKKSLSKEEEIKKFNDYQDKKRKK